jgi:hypothetical protein
LAARVVAGEVLGIAPVDVDWIELPGGGLAVRGLVEVGVCVSRTPGWAVASVRPGGRVGVDIEAWDRFGGDPDAAARWCAREAVAKACGAGLAWAMDPEGDMVDGIAPDPAGGRWRVVPLTLGGPVSGCVALPADSADAVSVREVCFGTIGP